MFSSWDEWRLMGAVLSIITKSVSYHTGCVHAKDICFIIGLQRLCAALIVWTRVNSRNAATEWWQHHKHCPGIIIIIIIIIIINPAVNKPRLSISSLDVIIKLKLCWQHLKY